MGIQRSRIDSDQGSMGLWNNRNALWSQKFDHSNRRVTRGIVVMEHPIVSNAWSHANNSFSQSFKIFTVIKLFNSVLEAQILYGQSLHCQKQMSMDFIFDLLLLAFFERGDADVCHSLLCLLLSESYSKIHVSSPVITFFKKFLSLWIHSRRWRHTSFRLSFCSIVRFLGTNFAHNFFMGNSSVKIWWTVVWFKFNSLWVDDLTAQGLPLAPHCYQFLKLVFQSGVKIWWIHGPLKMP